MTRSRPGLQAEFARAARQSLRVAHTLQPLPAWQVLAYAAHAARRRAPEAVRQALLLPATRISEAALPPASPRALEALAERHWGLGWDLDAARLQAAREFVSGNARFVGSAIAASDVRELPWRGPFPSRLWGYHLHYLDALVPLCASAGPRAESDWDGAAAVLNAWEAAQPLGADPGWEPYPTSLRLMNMLRAAALCRTHRPELAAKLLRAAAQHVGPLLCTLELHLRANHLLTNALALALAALVFAPSTGSGVFEAAAHRLLRVALHEQLGACGGHVERSPSYHALLLHWLEDVVAVARTRPQANEWASEERALARAAAWLATVRHPGGALPLFNDSAAAPGVPERPPAVRDRPATSTLLLPSGFAVLAAGAGWCIADVGAAAPDYQPGHAHAGALSIEYSHGGERLVTNRGVPAYSGPLRAWARSAASHSAVQLDGAEPLELWGDFRVGRRSRVEVLSTPIGHSAILEATPAIAAAQTWVALAGAPRHERRVSLAADGALHVADTVLADTPAECRVHLAPGVVVTQVNGGEASLRSTSGRSFRLRADHPLRLVATAHCDALGEPVSAFTLEWTFRQSSRFALTVDSPACDFRGVR